MKITHENSQQPKSYTSEPIGTIRVKESEYLETLEDLRTRIILLEEDGDKEGADFVRSMIDNYMSTGNSMLPVGLAKLEIIEG